MKEVFGVGGFNYYLLNAKNNTRSGLIQHVVMGNESADLDSIVSASVYAYFLRHHDRDSSVNIVPLINTGSKGLSSRQEAAFLFEKTGVDVANLLFLDSLCLEEFHSAGRLRLTLIDHNDLAVRQSEFKSAVVEIIDHHEAKKSFRISNTAKSSRWGPARPW